MSKLLTDLVMMHILFIPVWALSLGVCWMLIATMHRPRPSLWVRVISGALATVAFLALVLAVVWTLSEFSPLPFAYRKIAFLVMVFSWVVLGPAVVTWLPAHRVILLAGAFAACQVVLVSVCFGLRRSAANSTFDMVSILLDATVGILCVPPALYSVHFARNQAPGPKALGLAYGSSYFLWFLASIGILKGVF
jgi:hypothetical protein